MTKSISRADLSSEDVLGQARGLIGTYLISEVEGFYCAGKIVETEAYRGADDRAAHSFGHKRTSRTEVFFGEAGHAYVYFVYGMHRMFNVVTAGPGCPNAILIRAIEPVEGIAIMQQRRPQARQIKALTNGPAKICQSFGIQLSHYGIDLFDPKSPLRLEGPFGEFSKQQDGSSSRKEIIAGPRIGVDYAGEDALRPWRFCLKNSRFLSAPC